MTSDERSKVLQLANLMERVGDELKQPLVWLDYGMVRKDRMNFSISRASFIELLRGYNTVTSKE